MVSYINWTSGFPAAGSQAQSSTLGARDRKLRDIDGRHFPSMTYTTKGPTLLWAPNLPDQTLHTCSQERKLRWRWSHPGHHGLNALASEYRQDWEKEKQHVFVIQNNNEARSFLVHISYTFLGFLLTMELRERDFRVTQTPLSSVFSLPYCSSAPCCHYNGKGIDALPKKGDVKPLTEQRCRPRPINC